MAHNQNYDRRARIAAVRRPSGAVTAALITILTAAAVAAASCASAPRVEILSPGGNPRAAVRVEIANTQSAREVGLMYRSDLSENAGMLFVFSGPSRLQFWMKNTEIPLDMIFAGADGSVVGIVANAQPYSEKLLGVDSPAMYVLEVNGGFCARHGIKPGDQLRFAGFTPRSLD
jgi:uncharacterized membrane protein (UPF0127 family)